MLLIAGIVLVIIALLGFGGVIGVLRTAAWPILIVAIVVLAASFFI